MIQSFTYSNRQDWINERSVVSQLFENEGDQSVAVNLALGETQIVDETKK